MSVFCRRIKGMLHTEDTDDGYICGLTSVLQFSENGTMLQRDVKAFELCYTVMFCSL